MNQPALAPGGVAVVTGGASGIGLAAAKRFASLGMKTCICDLHQEALDRARAEIAAASQGPERDILAMQTDVSRIEAVQELHAAVTERLGEVSVLMNNAGIEAGGALFSPVELWRRILNVNLWGAIHGVQVFVPGMIASGRPGLVINTGSKQGITTPPGNTPYNVSKAGLRVMTEALAHELRAGEGWAVTAHLLIPGFVYTGLARARGVAAKPAGAWTPEQTVDFMLERLENGDFYILCPDNDVTRGMDEKRMAWAMSDLIENRPALSRWDPRWKERFEAYMRE